jgi:hypothetical protein
MFISVSLLFQVMHAERIEFLSTETVFEKQKMRKLGKSLDYTETSTKF